MDYPTHKSYGKLYVVATPIGNLNDITLRALKTLKEVSLIACEDTRHTIKLLNHYQIKNKLLSYFHPKERQKIPKIIGLLKQGKDVALVSDAGTPGISDPGFPLVREAINQGIQIIPIPGPSALTAALSAAGLPTHRFLFLGFAPPKKEATRKLLLSLKDEKATLVLYLPARKILLFLQLISETFGERQVVVAREITKIHEEFIRGSPEDIARNLTSQKQKGEVTILIEGVK
ncbi:MAG: 16S rRNA (cytidine(1402)-2'-O)-methyltransferase [Candidatus Aminicenantes bacterium]|nr:16S rRNA (cytidine(1402)-2'-O)-methyltransferase [Candidatus Aminicenantes bacterium]